MAIPGGWESLGSNDPTRYQARFPNQKRTGAKKIGTLAVVTDRATGNYDVYNETIFGRTLIYSYNRSSNKDRISNQTLYNDYFVGDDDQKEQKRRLDKSIKSSTLEISKDAAIGPTTRKEYETIASSDGYKSLGNNTQTVSDDAGDANDDGTQPQNPNGRSDTNDQTGLKDKSILLKGFDTNNIKGRTVEYITSPNPLRYPKIMPEVGYDFISITSFKYTPAGLNYSDRDNDKYDIETRLVGQRIQEIQLPMLPGISESNSITWGGDKVNPLQLIAGKLAMGLISGIGNFDLDKLRNAMGDTIEDIKRALEDSNTAPAVVAYFAGQAVGANIFTRATGTIVNPNLELLFNGPTLRTFNFNFKLTPRSEEEAIEIRKIIKSFKQNSLPQRSESNLFLLTPNIFKLKYIYGNGNGDEQHPFMNKIKHCALTSFNVNYAPEGSYMTFRGLPSMTCYEINMQFSEIQPIYADEIKSNDNSMGF